MQILHLIKSTEVGGGPQHLIDQVKLQSSSNTVHTFTVNFGFYCQEIGDISNKSFQNRKFYSFKSICNLLNITRRYKYDIIHFHGLGTLPYILVTLFSKSKKIYTPHGFSSTSKLKHKISEEIFRRASNIIDGVIYVSKSEYQYAKNKRLFSRIPHQIIPNGTDILRFNPKYTKLDKIRIVHISRLDYQKNTEELVRIATRLPDYEFHIYGNLPNLHWKKKNSCQNLTNVIFHGKVNDKKLIYEDKHILVNTSRWEGMSLAVMEALSYGIPCVLSAVRGNLDFNHRWILFYRKDDLSDLSKQINNMVSELRLNIDEVRKSCKIIHKNNYSVERMVEKTMTFYKLISDE